MQTCESLIMGGCRCGNCKNWKSLLTQAAGLLLPDLKESGEQNDGHDGTCSLSHEQTDICFCCDNYEDK